MLVTLKRETYRSGQAGAIGDILRLTQNRVRSAHATHLGYPYNLVGCRRCLRPSAIISSTISAIPMPDRTTARRPAPRARGRRLADGPLAVRRPRSLLGLGRRERHRGQYLGALPGARSLPSAVLLHSREGHYSIPKAARILRMDAIAVDCEDNGAIDSKPSPRRSMRSTVAGDRGADLRHHGEGRARRYRCRDRLPRRDWPRSGSAIHPCRRSAERHGAAVRRRRAVRHPGELPAWHRQPIDLRPQDRSARRCPAACSSPAGRMSTESPRRSPICDRATRR